MQDKPTYKEDNFAGSDDEIDPYKEAVKQEARDKEEDSEEDSEDGTIFFQFISLFFTHLQRTATTTWKRMQRRRRRKPRPPRAPAPNPKKSTTQTPATIPPPTEKVAARKGRRKPLYVLSLLRLSFMAVDIYIHIWADLE